MTPTIDFILIVFLIFLVALFLYLFTEINPIESGTFGILFMFLYVQNFSNLPMIPLSPLLALLFGALMFSLSGATVVGIIRRIC